MINMIRIKFLVIAFILIGTVTSAQRVATFEVQLDRPANGLSIPVSVDLDGVTFLSDSSLSLVEVNGSSEANVPFQIQQGDHRILTWNVNTAGNLKKKRTYRLVQTAPGKFNQVVAKEEDGALTIRAGDKNLLRYYFRTVYPPAGIDTNYRRSGFIHPLWTPKGQELTRIQAPDHYHHYGIWNPWTHVLFENDTVDFWNIRGRQGTVRFAKFISETNGNVFSEFEALHEHVALKKRNGGEKVALNELQTVKVYQPEESSDYYYVDITSKMSCASESPFKILAYRYAGLGWRTTGFWDKQNCEVLTSEGKTRKDTDNSKAKWCIVQGALPDNEYGGAVMLSYPGNYNHPEPMRIWVENTNGRGDMFANFAPTKDKDWLLEPGKTYVLKYRFVVFNGKFDKNKAESAWQYFANPPKVTIKK
jgi:hypothetical protein